MPSLTELRQSLTNRIVTTGQRVIGVVIGLPVINPLLVRFLPNFIDASTTRTDISYTISTRDVHLPAYPVTDIHAQVVQIAAALKADLETSELNFAQLLVDLPRLGIVNFNAQDVEEVSLKTAGNSELAHQRLVLVENFLSYVLAKEQHAGKTWITKDKLRAVVGLLSQKLVLDSPSLIALLSKNLRCIRTVNGRQELTQGLLPLMNKLSDDPPLIINLSMDEEKITLFYQQFLYCSPLPLDQMDPDGIQQDLRLMIKTTVDFACLDFKEGEMQPGSNAVTQEVSIESVHPDIFFATSIQMADASKHSVEAVVDEFLTSPAITPAPTSITGSTAPTPTAEMLEPESEEELGAAELARRKLYTPGFTPIEGAETPPPTSPTIQRKKSESPPSQGS